MEAQTGSKSEVRQQFEIKLLQIARRYHDDVQSFEMSASVFDRDAGLDSLDLAEVFSWVEQTFGISPMDDQNLKYESWDDLVEWTYNSQKNGASTH